MVQFHLGRKLWKICFKLLLCYSELGYVIFNAWFVNVTYMFLFCFQHFGHHYFYSNVLLRGLGIFGSKIRVGRAFVCMG